MGTGLARGRPRVSAVSKRSGQDPLSVGSTGYSSITNFRCPDLRAPWARLMAAGRRLAREGLGLEVSDLHARKDLLYSESQEASSQVTRVFLGTAARCFSRIQPFYLWNEINRDS